MAPEESQAVRVCMVLSKAVIAGIQVKIRVEVSEVRTQNQITAPIGTPLTVFGLLLRRYQMFLSATNPPYEMRTARCTTTSQKTTRINPQPAMLAHSLTKLCPSNVDSYVRASTPTSPNEVDVEA